MNVFYKIIFTLIFFFSAGPPSILVHPPPFTKVAEGHSVLITCSVAGKPDPIITWYRDSNLITGGRFKILPNGDLNISVRWFHTHNFFKNRLKFVYKMKTKIFIRVFFFSISLSKTTWGSNFGNSFLFYFRMWSWLMRGITSVKQVTNMPRI